MTTVLDRPPAPTATDRTPGLRAFALVGFVATSAIVLGAMAGGKSFVSTFPGTWFFGAPGGPLGSLPPDGGHPSVLAMFGVYGGLLLLGATWWRLVRTLDVHRGMAVRRVILVVAVGGGWRQVGKNVLAVGSAFALAVLLYLGASL